MAHPNYTPVPPRPFPPIYSPPEPLNCIRLRATGSFVPASWGFVMQVAFLGLALLSCGVVQS